MSLLLGVLRIALCGLVVDLQYIEIPIRYIAYFITGTGKGDFALQKFIG